MGCGDRPLQGQLVPVYQLDSGDRVAILRVSSTSPTTTWPLLVAQPAVRQGPSIGSIHAGTRTLPSAVLVQVRSCRDGRRPLVELTSTAVHACGLASVLLVFIKIGMALPPD